MITKADLEKELSAKELLDLTDLNGNDVVDEAVLADAISDAESFVASFIVIPADPTPYLKSIAVDLAIYELKKLHGLHDKETLTELEKKLSKMAGGSIPTTVTQEAAPRKTGSAFRHGDNRRMDLRGFRLDDPRFFR